MITVLAVVLIAAGVLLMLVGLRMWFGAYYEANPAVARIFPYGSEAWTMPVPMAGYGAVFTGIGALLLVPRQLVGIAVAVIIIGGVAGFTFSIWQPRWATPPSLRHKA